LSSSATSPFSSLCDLLARRGAAEAGQRAYTFLRDGGGAETLSYAELDSRARAAASFLERNARRGDRVLLVYPPGLEFLAAFFGCLYARVIPAPLPLPGSRSGFEKLVLVKEDTEARLALTTAAHLAEGRAGLRELAWEAIDASNEGASAGWEGQWPAADELAYLQYTSGSTSVPRGVMLTHANVLHNLANIDVGFEHGPETVIVTWLPHFHDMGLIYGLLAPLYGGFPCYAMAPASFVQRPLAWLQAITQFRATHSGGPNFAYDLCVRRIPPADRAGLDLSSWEVAFNGAEPVHAETIERFSEAFCGCGFRRSAFYPAYGLAEASLKVSGGRKGEGPVIFAADAPCLTRNRVQEAVNGEARLLVGCGKAGPDTRVEIVDPETLSRAAGDEVGEIWVCGPGVARGYWNRPEETKETFEAHIQNSGDGPFLRTGDLGFVRDGELYIAGRLKDLIIIRGLNHHPGDIELTARRAHPALASSVGAAFAIEAAGEERLALAMEAGKKEPADAEKIAATVRQAIAGQHEVQLYAFVLVRKGGIPKTSSGKVQRRLCRSLYLAGELDVVYRSIVEEAAMEEAPPAAPRDRLSLVSWLRDLVARVLQLSPAALDVSRPVTSYGLDSLGAMELENRLEEALGVRLALEEILEGASVERLAELAAAALEEDGGVAGPAPAARGEAKAPLSFEQERLWILDQIAPGNAAYHIPFAVRVRGPLDEEVLARSAGEVMKRHESLRTCFRLEAGRPMAIVTKVPDAPMKIEEAREIEDVLERAAGEVRRPFDLKEAPLFRLRLFRMGVEDRVCLLVTHHIVSDVWSVRLFFEELFRIYGTLASGQEPALEPLPIQYGDFVAWQRERLQGERLEKLAAWWREHLSEAPPLALPLDRARPKAPSFRGAIEPFEIPAELAVALRGVSRWRGSTLFTTLLGGFGALLARWANQTDVVVGITSANRNRPEIEKLIGFFAAPLVVRIGLGGDPEFGEIWERVRKELLAAYAHQELPFANVVEAAHPGRQPGYTPLFQVMFSLVKPLLAEVVSADLALEALEINPGATDFDLFVNLVDDGEGLRGHVIYNTDLFDRETVRAAIESYQTFLQKAAADARTRLSQLALAERLKSKTEAAEDRSPAILVAATFTAEPVEEIVAFWMNELGFEYRVRFAPYNQVFQQLLDPGSLLGGNQSGVNVLLIRLQDWMQGGGTDLDEVAGNLVSSLRGAVERTAAPFLVCLCPPLPDARVEGLIRSGFQGSSSVHVVGPDEIQTLYPVAEYYDAHGDRLGHVPYTPEFFAALGTVISRKTHALRTAGFKVIVLDCDHTLWNGVCGEDGPEGVTVDPPYAALQKFMRAQHEAGMLLAMASKNNLEDVMNTFAAHPEMPLRREHFAGWRINWGPKSGNLRELARELDLGLDSFILVDDNPAECAEVEANCPEVLTLQLPKNAEEYPDFLRHVWAFDRLTTTEEDRKRTEMYGRRLQRIRLQHQVVTLREFLEALELEVTIGPAKPAELARVAQLSQRTNQMNVSTRRRTAAEVAALLREGGAECLTVHVTDRFGSYGLVGVMIFTTDGELVVDTFLLSCRALGRGVEHRMLARLGETAAGRGLGRVTVPYIRTAKNQPAYDFLHRVGGDFEQAGDGGLVYRFPAEWVAAVAYNPDSRPGEAVQEKEAVRAEAPAHPVDYGRIARELNDPAKILAHVRATRRPDAVSTIAFEPPRTPLEARLAALWAEVLHVPQVGVNDNFFDLGGHSLLAVQLISRVRETFDADLPLDVVFAGNFCVAELAKAIEIHEIGKASPEEYEALLKELEGLTDDEVRALIEQEGSER
jgi:FkbH-like protein